MDSHSTDLLDSASSCPKNVNSRDGRLDEHVNRSSGVLPLQYDCLTLGSIEACGHDAASGDTITCFKVSEKFLVIGRESGRLELVDYNGDVIKKFHEHRGAVRDVCFDGRSSEYLATCSDDGTAVMYSLYSEQGFVQKFKVDNGVRRLAAVALDPHCSNRKTKELVVGDDQGRVYFLSSGWLGHSETILFSGKYKIDTIVWSGTLVAWASLSGVRLYDVSCHQPVGTLGSLRALGGDDDSSNGDKVTILHCLENNVLSQSISPVSANGRNLFLGSARGIYHVSVPQCSKKTFERARDGGDHAIDQLTSSLVFKAETGSSLCSFIVHAFGPSLTLTALTQRNQECNIFEMQVPAVEIDHLYRCNIPKLAESRNIILSGNSVASLDSGEPLFFIQTARDITAAKPLDAVSRLEILCQSGYFEDAISLIDTNNIEDMHKKEFVEKYMNRLLDDSCSEKAGLLAAKLLGDDIAAWERWTTTLARAKKVHQIAPLLPFQGTENASLSKSTYDLVIKSCMQQRKYKISEDLVKTWPIDLYDAQTVLSMAKERLASETKDSKVLSTLLVNIFSKLGMHQDAVDLLISTLDKNVFEYIQQHRQYVGFTVPKLVTQLMEIDTQKTIKLLVDNFDVAPPPEVVKAIYGASGEDMGGDMLEINMEGMSEKWALRLYKYLALLHRVDPSMNSFDTLLVELCAKLDPENIMALLQSSNAYKLDRALQSCVQHDLIFGQVLVLERMGLKVDALHIIIHKIQDVSQAVSFARDCMDNAIWDELSHLASQNQGLASELLACSGDGIDTGKLLRAVPPDMTLPGLKEKLINATRRIRQELSFQECCQLNAHSDCSQLLHRLYQQLSVALDSVIWDENEENLEVPIVYYHDRYSFNETE